MSQEGYDTNCTNFGDVPADFSCSDVLITYDLTLAQFYKMNPAVGSDCANLWTAHAYCIASPSAPPPKPSENPTSTATPSSTTAPGPSAPTHSGQPANCVKWHTVADGDSCPSLADKYFITLAQFFAWNPAVSEDCTENFWLGQAYCVGTADSISVTRSAPLEATPTNSFIIPTPNQANNAVSNCNKAAQALEGDHCSVSCHNMSSTMTLTNVMIAVCRAQSDNLNATIRMEQRIR